MAGLDPYEQDHWIHKRLKAMKRMITCKKSPFEKTSYNELNSIFDSIFTCFEIEKYDACVFHIKELCRNIETSLHDFPNEEINLSLIRLELDAIRTLIELNNSVNLERDEVIFLIVTLDRLIEELVD